MFVKSAVRERNHLHVSDRFDHDVSSLLADGRFVVLFLNT